MASQQSTVDLISAGAKWQALRESATGRTFYYNTQTSQTQWDKPYEMTLFEGHLAAQIAQQQAQVMAAAWQTGTDATGRKYYFNTMTSQARYDRPAELGPEPSQWRQHQTANGELFYHNATTNKSQYERPQGF